MDFVYSTFTDFESTETAVLDYCQTNCHPIRAYMTEKTGLYNKKVKDESKIPALPETPIYACRYVQCVCGVQFKIRLSTARRVFHTCVAFISTVKLDKLLALYMPSHVYCLFVIYLVFVQLPEIVFIDEYTVTAEY